MTGLHCPTAAILADAAPLELFRQCAKSLHVLTVHALRSLLGTASLLM